MSKKLKDLIDLKSIITLLLVASLVGVIFTHVNIDDEAIKALFISVTSMSFTYYFTRKKNNTEGAQDELKS